MDTKEATEGLMSTQKWLMRTAERCDLERRRQRDDRGKAGEMEWASEERLFIKQWRDTLSRAWGGQCRSG